MPNLIKSNQICSKPNRIKICSKPNQSKLCNKPAPHTKPKPKPKPAPKLKPKPTPCAGASLPSRAPALCCFTEHGRVWVFAGACVLCFAVLCCAVLRCAALFCEGHACASVHPPTHTLTATFTPTYPRLPTHPPTHSRLPTCSSVPRATIGRASAAEATVVTVGSDQENTWHTLQCMLGHMFKCCTIR